MKPLLRRIADIFYSSQTLYVAYDNGVRSRKLPVVFLHGIAASSADFASLKDKLPRDRRVVHIDLLGHGASPRVTASGYSLVAHLRSIDRTLRSIGIKECEMVGYSMGALLAIAYAGRYGGVKRVMCCSMPLYAYEQPDTMWHKVIERLYAVLSEKENMTLRIAKMIMMLPNPHSGFHLTEDNWDAFCGSMKSVIERYNPLQDARGLTRMTMLVGRIDPFVSLGATKKFAADVGAEVIEVNSALHTMTNDYDRAILRALGTSG